MMTNKIVLICLIIASILMMKIVQSNSEIYRESICKISDDNMMLSVSASTDSFKSTRSISIDKKKEYIRLTLGISDRKGFARSSKDITTISFQELSDSNFKVYVLFDESYLENLNDNFLKEHLRRWELGIVSEACKNKIENFLLDYHIVIAQT